MLDASALARPSLVLRSCDDHALHSGSRFVWRHLPCRLTKISAMVVVADRYEQQSPPTRGAVIEGSHKLKHRLVAMRRVLLAATCRLGLWRRADEATDGDDDDGGIGNHTIAASRYRNTSHL